MYYFVVLLHKTIKKLGFKRLTNIFIGGFLLFTLLFFVASCSYKNKNVLFKTHNKINSKIPVLVLNEGADTLSNYKHRIKIGDRVQIRFLNNYDIGQGAMQSATSAGNNSQIGITDKGYLVNYDSTVTLPLLGRLNLVGLTRLEAAQKLEKEYSRFIINPIIDLNIASLSVTILGEVNIPGKILLDKETTTIVDVIALAGGFKDTGKKKDIKIIRGQEVIIIDLKKIESLNSKKLIIQDNDIVYVEPYGAKAAFESSSSLNTFVSIILTFTQLIVISLQAYTISKTLK